MLIIHNLNRLYILLFLFLYTCFIKINIYSISSSLLICISQDNFTYYTLFYKIRNFTFYFNKFYDSKYNFSFSIFCISLLFISTPKITWADSTNENLSTTSTSYSNLAININANCFSITKQPYADSNYNLFNVKVNKDLLPTNVKNFTKIRVVTSDTPFDHPSVPYQVTETKIHDMGYKIIGIMGLIV